MPLEVRSIAPDELLAWGEVLQVAFHSPTSSSEHAAFRRDVLRQDLARTLAGFDDGRLVGTLLSYPAELTLPGGTRLVTNAVAAASVLPTHRRRGLLTAMMEADLKAATERGDAAAILLPSEYPIYGRFGFGPCTEHATYELDCGATRFNRGATGSLELVDAERARRVAPNLFDRFRCEWPGQIDRPSAEWDMRLGLIKTPWSAPEAPRRFALFAGAAGATEGYEGYVVYGVERGTDSRSSTTLVVDELVALSDDAYLGLWRYCAEVDLVQRVRATTRRVDEPLPWLLHDPRRALRQTSRGDLLWLRPLDVVAVLATRRYASEGRLIVDIQDPNGWCGGRFAVEGGAEGATCRPTRESADLGLAVGALGAISLGGVSVRELAAAGRVDEQRPGAVAAADRLFRWPVAPWCSTRF